jgi:DNA-binding NarL/FixJ family response regulator
MLTMVKIVVAEDHALVRQGISMLLSATGGYQLVAETALGSEVEMLVELHKPDLLLLDLALGDSSGIEVTRKVKKVAPRTKVLIVTGNVYPGSVANAFAAGADGFVPKHEQGSELLDAIQTVLSGRQYISQQVSKGLDSAANGRSSGAGLSQTLTQREQQIVRMIAKGGSNQEIADALHISVLTARKHRQNVMLKLGLHNGAEIAAYAIQSGLAEAPDLDSNL